MTSKLLFSCGSGVSFFWLNPQSREKWLWQGFQYTLRTPEASARAALEIVLLSCLPFCSAGSSLEILV